jgi:pyruvate dehydrogenase E2 component (dihydrolipoamide acetyltransferase)
MLAFVIKASVAALKKFPAFNASLDEKGENLILKKYYNIGFAADTRMAWWCRSSRTPTRRASARSPPKWANCPQARDGKLKPADMQGATFTISSLGGIGGTAFRPSSMRRKWPSWACPSRS